ncbi:MAG: stalk domain-containing protein [Moorellales bacterium]
MAPKTRPIALLLAAVFSLALFAVLPGGAAAQDISVYVDGERLALDQPPVLEDSRTLVPLRVIFEALGAEVTWDGATQTVTARRQETTVRLTIGSHTAYRNGQAVILDVPAKVVGGRTLVPVRFVFEALGAAVGWDGNTRTVTVNSSGSVPSTGALLKVHFLDVGQADSILVRLPDGRALLIDGGNNADGPAVVSYLKAQGIERLDWVVATHPHEDHVGGLDAVLDAFEVGKVYAPRATTNTRAYEDFLLAVQRKGLKIAEARAGVTLFTGPGLTAAFVAPNRTGYEDLNNYSAVLRLVYGQTSFLFAGDAETESKAEMLVANHALKADVFKVGHHGSESSTTPAFLAAVSPRYAVISVGAGNDYGHPSPETLARLAEAKVEVFRTDLQGAIVAASDGQKITFDKAAPSAY